jgi:hypothetical protein
MSLSLPHVSLRLALPHVHATTSAHLLRNLVVSTPPLSISNLQDSVQSIVRPPLVPFTSRPLPITHGKATLSSLVSNIVVYLFAHIINWPPINVGALTSPRTLVRSSHTSLSSSSSPSLSSSLPTPGHRSLHGPQLLHPLSSRSLTSASPARGCSSGPLSSPPGYRLFQHQADSSLSRVHARNKSKIHAVIHTCLDVVIPVSLFSQSGYTESSLT